VVNRWRQKQDDDDKSRTAVGSAFQAAGPDTEKLRDPYRDSQQHGILKSRREHDRRHERPDAVDTGMHMSVTYAGAVRRRHLLEFSNTNLLLACLW